LISKTHKSFLIVLSAPSGAGKTTIFRAILEKDPQISYSVSETTRPCRNGEVNGKDYFFVTPEHFQHHIETGYFAEWAIVHHHYYGTPRQYIQQQLDQGFDVLLDIDVQGARQIRQVYPEGVFIFIVPPSIQVLEERLRARKTDTEAAIRHRIEMATEELSHIDDYQYLVINDQLPQAIAETHAIIQAERCRRTRSLFSIQDLLPVS